MKPPKRKRDAAKLYALAQPNGNADPTTLGGNISGPGGPHDFGAVVIDMTDVVLLEGMHASTVDTVRNGVNQGTAIYMQLDGRVNKTTRRVRVGFMMPPDGAAAIITELMALADRFGAELRNDLIDRLSQLHKENNVDLRALRAAIDNALEGQ